MNKRITSAVLKQQIAILNKITGAEPEPYRTLDNGQLEGNAGTYTLDSAYGGVKLCQMAGNGTGENDISMMGYMPKRELYIFLYGMIAGIEAKQNR